MTTTQVTTSITLTLLFRSLGAVIFGVLADRYGRKWTLVGNLILICIFELASGFVNTYSEFLAVRSLFGIAMGGIWYVSLLSRESTVRSGDRFTLGHRSCVVGADCLGVNPLRRLWRMCRSRHEVF